MKNKNASGPIGRTNKEVAYVELLEKHFEGSSGSTIEKLRNFSKYVPRQDLALFIAKYELFSRVLNVHGSIIEGGVHLGGGLMTFAQLSAIFEPVNYQRKIIGFDTFEGFPSVAKEDSRARSALASKGAFSISDRQLEDLERTIELFDQNRFVSHVPKVELVKGDVAKTLPRYLKENPQTVVSLLYLDFDIFEPTKAAIELLLPRMPKGAILAFDELNLSDWPGETLAVLQSIGIRNLKLERFPFVPKLSFAVIQ